MSEKAFEFTSNIYSLLPDNEEIFNKVTIDDISISRGRDVEPWFGKSEEVIKGRNFDAILTNKALYLIAYGYKGIFKTLTKYTEILKNNKKNIVKYLGAAMISRDVYIIPVDSIESVSLSHATGIARKYQVNVLVESTRPWGMIMFGFLLFLGGLAGAYLSHSTNALLLGAFLSLIGFFLMVIYAGKRYEIDKDVETNRIDETKRTSRTIVKILVRYYIPVQAKIINENNKNKTELLYNVELYTIMLESYDENAKKLLEIGKRLIAMKNGAY